jgi:hypothetical protein
MDLNVLIGASEIDLLGQQEARFPQLARLNQDFSLCVLETTSADQACKSFVLVSPRHQQLEQTALTQSFVSLDALEQHTDTHMTDILDGYLFEPLTIQPDSLPKEHLATPA